MNNPQQPQEEDLKVEEIEVIKVNSFGKIIQSQPRIVRYFIEDLGNGVTLEMAAISGGSFTMGAPTTENDSLSWERPEHEVTIKPFFMGKYPITQAQWRQVATLPKVNYDLNPNPSCFKGQDHPVEQVSWDEVVEFCQRLFRKTTRNYRLPSEAEWEYACRAGTITPFYFGETITTDLANYNGYYKSYGNAPQGHYREETTPVGHFPPNDFGLYDMHGNVCEWCADHSHDSYEGSPTDGTAWLNQNNHGIYILRGGSWRDNPGNCRSASRHNNNKEIKISSTHGFRVVYSGAERT